jgi:thiol-disulfide isomerase/thioredoxin
MNQRNLLTGVSVRIAAGLFAAAVVVLVTIALTPAAPPDGPPRTGGMSNFILSSASAPAPRSPFVDEKNVAHTLDDFRGKVVLVNFWATWCGPCVREMPSLKRLHAKLGGGEFTVLAMSEDRRGWEVMAPFLVRLDLLGLPAFHDPRGDLMRALSVHGLPTTILFGRDGRELGRLVGTAEWDSDEAVALVRHYLVN